MDILSYVIAHIGRSLPKTSAGNQLLGKVLKSSDLAIIALNSLLPACIRSGKDSPALCLTPGILLHIRVGIWLSIELCNIELSGVKIAMIVPRKRRIRRNRVFHIKRGNSCLVKEASNSRGGVPGERKAGIDLIVIDQSLVGSIGSDIHTLNVTKNTDELRGMVAGLNVPTSSFAEILQSVVPENRQSTLVWCCIPMHHLWELASLPQIGT